MALHEFIRRGRQGLGLSQEQFAAALGVTRSAVQQWERPGGTGPRRALQPKVAEVLGVSVAELMGAMLRAEKKVSTDPPKVPLLPADQAATYLEVDNFRDLDGHETIAVPVSVKRHTFAMVVRGEAMVSTSGDSFTDGSIVVVEPTLPPAPGDYVVFVRDDHPAALRQLVAEAGSMLLKPLNPRYPLQTLEGIAVVGVVRACFKQFR